MNQIILTLILILFLVPVSGGAQEAGKTGQAEETGPVTQPAPAPSSGESKVVVEIPRSQWCQCVRALLGVEGGNIAGCVASGASEEKLKIFRMRGTGGKSASVSFLLSFAGCTESENENVGSLSFSIQWLGPPISPPNSKAGSPAAPPGQFSSPITCEAGGINAVVATLYHANGVKLASAGPLNCSTPVFTLNNIPVNANLRLVVTGKNAAGNVLHRGERTGITIAYHESTALGTIPAPSFIPGLSMPEDAALLGSGNVRYLWSDVRGASTYRLQASKNSNFASPVIDASTASASYGTKTDLPTGSYFWRVMAKDTFNNIGEWSNPWSVTVDADPPINTTADNFINNGAPKTYVASVSLVISATKKTGVTGYYISNRPEKPTARKTGWTTIPSTPAYQAEIPFTLSKGDGVKKIYVWFTDALGHVSKLKGGAILLDSTPPHAKITSHPTAITNSTSAAFAFVSSKANSRFQCRLDGIDTACTSTMTYKELPDGSHTFTVRATGAAGDERDPDPPSFTWTIDSKPPHTVITNYPPVLTNATLAEFGFSATKPDSTFRCRLDDEPMNACSSPLFYSGLTGGSHTFTVGATDAVNNVEATPAQYTWTVDVTPFTAIITKQPPNPSASTEASISFTASKPAAAFHCQLDSGSYSVCSSPMAYKDLAEGSHTFSVKAIDDKGNESASPARAVWTIGLPPVNTTPPGFINIHGTYFTHKILVTLSISATSNKGVTGYFASESPVPPNTSDQNWVTFPATKLYDQEVQYTLSDITGTKKVYVWFKDGDGNVSEVRSDTIYRFNAHVVVLVSFLFQVVIILVAG